MALSFSTGLKRKLANGETVGSLREIFGGGQLIVYSGSAPSGTVPAADAVLSGPVAVWTIMLPAAGSFDADGSGKVAITASNLTGTVPATPAAATFFRLVQAGDDGSADSAGLWARVQGTVGLVGSNPDFIVSNTTFVAGSKTLSSFSLRFG